MFPGDLADRQVSFAPSEEGPAITCGQEGRREGQQPQTREEGLSVSSSVTLVVARVPEEQQRGVIG